MRFAIHGLIGMTQGLAFTALITPLVVYRAVFVVAIGYAVAFALWKTKAAWVVAGVVCGVVENLISIPYWLMYGTTWQSIAVLLVEWFVAASIAGLLAMLVPSDRSGKSKSGPTYY